MWFQRVEKSRKRLPHRDFGFQRFTAFQGVSEYLREIVMAFRRKFPKVQRNIENCRYLHIFRDILGELHRQLGKSIRAKWRVQKMESRDFSDTLAPTCQECLWKLLTFYCNMKSPVSPHLSKDIVCGSLVSNTR